MPVVQIARKRFPAFEAEVECGGDPGSVLLRVRSVPATRRQAVRGAHSGQRREDDGCAGDGHCRHGQALPRAHGTQFPFAPNAMGMFAANPALAAEAALRNAGLQGAYLMIAACFAGFSVGPTSGFDREELDAAFLAGAGWSVDFLFHRGVADRDGVRPRGGACPSTRSLASNSAKRGACGPQRPPMHGGVGGPCSRPRVLERYRDGHRAVAGPLHPRKCRSGGRRGCR